MGRIDRLHACDLAEASVLHLYQQTRSRVHIGGRISGSLLATHESLLLVRDQTQVECLRVAVVKVASRVHVGVQISVSLQEPHENLLLDRDWTHVASGLYLET